MGFTKKSRAAVASSGEVESAANELLAKGNAIDAVVAGAFAACAAHPSVLLGPVQILFGGAGAGFRALDGRVRQPGLGAPRPRGFQAGEEVPDAARVGVPFLPAVLGAALATAGSATFSAVLGPAVASAKGTARLDVLSKLASRGPRAIEERPLSAELLALCGRTNGGLLTSDDLSSPRPELLAARRIGRGPKSIATLPWAHVEDDAILAPQVSAGTTRAVVAVDRHATFAIATWDESPEGIMIDELGFRAPFFADPVMRGEPRTKPGDVRPAAGAMALFGESPDMALAAFGAGDAYDVLGAALTSLVHTDQLTAHGDARLVVLSHANGVASVLR